MSRLAACFSTLKTQHSKALVTFITAGDPDLPATEEMIYLLEEAGADVRLTEAVILLGRAKDKVSDFVDGVAYGL